MKPQHRLAMAQDVRATNVYNLRYTSAANEAYKRATAGKSVAYANALIDDALALCGHPYYKISNRQWSEEALDFLGHFGRI